MKRRKTLPSTSLSMLDLVSNALAAVIILFFILSTARIPSIPPERVCGTVYAEIGFMNPQDKSSLCYVSYDGDGDEYDKMFMFEGNSGDHSMNELNNSILAFQKDSSCYEENERLHERLLPAISCYRTGDSVSYKHVIVMHDPPEGDIYFGMLYTDYKTILNDQRTDSVKFHVKMYLEGQEYEPVNKVGFIRSATDTVSWKIQIVNNIQIN